VPAWVTGLVGKAAFYLLGSKFARPLAVHASHRTVRMDSSAANVTAPAADR
jgi:hypothetical protein